jgi:hypothetical protein
MTSWHVAPDLATLIAQVKTLHPGMIVGTIGDTAHQNEASDHDPDADGSVNAADFMIGSTFSSSDAGALATRLALIQDSRMAYVIYNRRICSTTVSPGVWRTYTGSDPHTNHVHVSVTHTAAAENNAKNWDLGGKMHTYDNLAGLGLPELAAGQNDDDYTGYRGIARAQALLNYLGANLATDGDYGPATTAAVKRVCGGDGKTIRKNQWITLAGLSTGV